MMIKHESEKGQAIVFLVLGLVVFMGFVALAIDGGMAFADRRHSQNGSDAASLAGGGEAALYIGKHTCLLHRVELQLRVIFKRPWQLPCQQRSNVPARTISTSMPIRMDGNGVTTVCGEQ